MNVHGALYHRVRLFGVHDVEDAVYCLVSTGPENGSAENFFAIGIYENFHKSLGLALFDCTGNAGHRTLTDQNFATGRDRFRFGHSSATERWIDEQAISRNTIGNSARIVVQQVCSNDLVIVVGRVREGAFAVAIADSPDAGNVSSKLIINNDVALLVDSYARLVEAEVVGIRHASDRQ